MNELVRAGEAAERLASEGVVVSAPMSFAGAAERSWKLTRRMPRALWIAIALLLIAAWWIAVAAWYVGFGVALIPYRLIRRGQRKRKLDALRHRETLGAIEKRP